LPAGHAARINSLTRNLLRVQQVSRATAGPIKLALGLRNQWSRAEQRSTIMGGQILVALKDDDRLEEIIPYIERIAQPGMRVVYLIRHSVIVDLKTIQDFGMGGEFLEEPSSIQKKIERDTVEEEQARLSQHKVFLAQEALRKKGIEMVVDVYRGRLKKVVGRYLRKGDVKFILTRARGVLHHIGFLQELLSLVGLFKRPMPSPMVLVHPGTFV
jgi:hypothetical protein